MVAAHAPKLVLALGRLDEDDVGAGLGECLAPGDRLVEPEAGAGVGARDDERVVPGPRMQATSILRHMSRVGITRRFGVCPHFFGIS